MRELALILVLLFLVHPGLPRRGQRFCRFCQGANIKPTAKAIPLIAEPACFGLQRLLIEQQRLPSCFNLAVDDGGSFRFPLFQACLALRCERGDFLTRLLSAYLDLRLLGEQRFRFLNDLPVE